VGGFSAVLGAVVCALGGSLGFVPRLLSAVLGLVPGLPGSMLGVVVSVLGTILDRMAGIFGGILGVMTGLTRVLAGIRLPGDGQRRSARQSSGEQASGKKLRCFHAFRGFAAKVRGWLKTPENCSLERGRIGSPAELPNLQRLSSRHSKHFFIDNRNVYG
jgi:hypothetical protein